MRIFFSSASARLMAWLRRPSRDVIPQLLALNLVAICLTVFVGRPLGDVKHMPFTPLTVLHVLFSAELLCTLVSFLQLLLTAAVLRDIYYIRREHYLRAEGKRSGALIWLLMWAGFAFLAIDEVAFVHEGIDKLIHFIGGIEETSLTDRLDDILPGVYALIGMGVLWHFRAELRPFRGFWPMLAAGMLIMLMMIGLDVLTNRKDILMQWLADPAAASFWWAKCTALEEGCKILAEAVFLGMFLRCRETARTLSTGDGQAALRPAA